MRKRQLAIVTFVVLIFASVYITKVVIHEREITAAIQHQLFVEKQYQDSDIEKISVSYHIGRLILGYDPFITSVIFSDEPDTIYFYEYRGKRIYQFGMGGKSYGGKH